MSYRPGVYLQVLLNAADAVLSNAENHVLHTCPVAVRSIRVRQLLNR